MSVPVKIRPAEERDVEEIHTMICELAEFEKMADQVVSTSASVKNALFGLAPCASAIVAELDDDGSGPQTVGFALYFQNYSTFTGKPGLYLEDVYVRPAFRKLGVGRALLKQLATIARDRCCGRFEWAVLDWNENAIAFYEGLGATVLSDWRIVRMDGDAMERFVAS